MITVVTLCRNEQYLAPFFLRHYAFADWIVVYDNQSTDRSREILSADKRVHIVSYDTGGVLDDLANLKFKNEAYKQMAGDWFIIVDFDEFVQHENIHDYLDRCTYHGVTIPRLDGWNMIGDAVPVDDGRPMIELITQGVRDPHYCKSAIVHRDVDIRYQIGGHTCFPLGRVKYSQHNEVKLLHFNWLSREHGLEKRRRTSTALSPSNIANGFGLQVFNLDGEAQWYDDARARRVEVLGDQRNRV